MIKLNKKLLICENLTVDTYIPQGKKVSVTYHREVENYRLHSHDYFEIELILAGSAIHIINGQKYEIKKGSMYFLTPSDFHEYILHDGCELELINISFEMSYIDAKIIFGLLLAHPYIIADIDEKRLDFLTGLFAQCLDEYSSNDIHGDIVVKNLVEIIVILISRLCKTQIPLVTTNQNNVKKILVYIHSHFKESINLQDISKYMRLSTKYISDIFKDATGKTIVQYINDIRLEYATRILITHDNYVSITEVCYECGYNSLPNFHRDFKKRYKTSPFKYRIQLKR